MLKCGLRRMARALCLWAALIAGGPAVAAPPQCKLVKYLELPVQLIGGRAIVTTQIAGKDARFILDSGAFYSVMSRATAAEFNVPLQAAPYGFSMRGINGDASAEVGTVADFTLGGVKMSRVQFLIGGTDTGSVGLLGQNSLSTFDVEYDFPHGMIRLFRASNCPGVSAAYWAGDQPVTQIPLEGRRSPVQSHTIGSVTLDGAKMTALFDTGAPASGLTRAAAKRAGVTPQSPGVTEEGFDTGLGNRSLKVWMGTFGKIDLGGEAIPHPRLRFADFEMASDMLIGFDFFLSHRVLVLNSVDRMLMTYEGGPVFGFAAKGAVTATGSVIDLTHKGDAAPKDADGFARRGAVLASQGKPEAAIADFDAAVALAPADPRLLVLRARARVENRQPLQALDDLGKAMTIDPANPEPYLLRAEIRLRARDRQDALTDLTAADKALPPSSDKRLSLSFLFDEAGAPEAALANDELWLKSHPEDAQRPAALNGRCWTRALLNRDLDKALADCNTALRARPADPAMLDSRALVHFRRGEWALAKADYDVCIARLPKEPLSLYVRGLARAKLGDAAGAAADRAAALAIGPAVAERAKRLGLES